MALFNKEPRKFLVQGRTPFPMDMLRYDSCYPQTTEDAAKIARSIKNRPERREIALATHSPSVTNGRWSSHGWRIIEASDELRIR